MRTHHIKLGPGLKKMSPCGCYKYFYHKRNMISHKRKCQKSSYYMKMLTSVKRNKNIQVSSTLPLLVLPHHMNLLNFNSSLLVCCL